MSMAWMTLPGGSNVASASVNVPVPQPRSHHVCARAPAIWSTRINSVASAMYIAIWLWEPGSFRLQGYCHPSLKNNTSRPALFQASRNSKTDGSPRNRQQFHRQWANARTLAIIVSNSRLKLLTWQELAAVLPGHLQNFLAAKYGIVPAI